MPYIYLDDNDVRNFFLNRYLERKEFVSKNRPSAEYTSFKLYNSTNPENYSAYQVIFLSQFESAVIHSEKDLIIFNKNYNIPSGFLELKQGKSKKPEIFDNISETQNIIIDDNYLSIRNSLINTFISTLSGKDEDLANWFTIINNLTRLSDFQQKLIAVINEVKDFPQVEMTSKLSKNTKLELQFIYLGRLLGELFFSQSEGKIDETHRNWLMNLNPEKNISFGPTPEKFKSDAEVILGYIVALKYNIINKKVSLNQIKDYYKNIEGFKDSQLSLYKAAFYTMFWLGLLKSELTNIFHTNISSSILLSIEKKAYQLNKLSENSVFEKFNDDFIKDWIKIKEEKLRASSKRFTDYCRMYSGESPSERTEKELIQKIEPYNLLTKESLIFFFKEESSLKRLFQMLSELRFIKYVLLVYKQQIPIEKKNENLERDFINNQIKKQFSKNYPKIHFEIIEKNVNDRDDRDIINNLKGYIKKHCTENNFIYLTDEQNDNESYREKLWLGKAFSSTPIFDNEENYLFVL